MNDNKKAFDFIFGGGFEYSLDYIERWKGVSSLLSNISHYGIQGSDKNGIGVDDLVHTIVSSSYSSYFFIIKEKGGYNLLYLWANSKNGDDSPRKNMQSNSLWFFTILKELVPKGIIIKTDIQRGYDVSTYIRKVSEIQGYLDRHLESDRALPGSRYIRINITSSRYGLFEIYKKYFTEVTRDLDALKIDYKVLI